MPIISTEAVVGADPEAILTASETSAIRRRWQRDPGNASFATWHRHGSMTAVRRAWLYTLNGDIISRQGPRIVDGAAAVCAVARPGPRRTGGALTRLGHQAVARTGLAARLSAGGAESHQRTTAQTSHSGRSAWQT